MIPERHSKKWFILFIVYTSLVLVVFLFSKILLGGDALRRGIQGILLLSIGSSLLPCIGGYLGKRIFFIVYTFSVIVGMIYALYTIIADTSPGWGDLTSIIGYLFIIGIGFIVAANAELANYFIQKRRKNKLTL